MLACRAGGYHAEHPVMLMLWHAYMPNTCLSYQRHSIVMLQIITSCCAAGTLPCRAGGYHAEHLVMLTLWHVFVAPASQHCNPTNHHQLLFCRALRCRAGGYHAQHLVMLTLWHSSAEPASAACLVFYDPLQPTAAHCPAVQAATMRSTLSCSRCGTRCAPSPRSSSASSSSL